MVDTNDSDIETSRNNVYCENGIIVYRLVTPVDDVEAKRLDEAGRVFLDRNEADRILIDIQSSSNFSSAARKRWVHFLQNPSIVKTAIFGGNIFIRTLATFVIGATKKKNIKFFGAEQEAHQWLITKVDGQHKSTLDSTSDNSDALPKGSA